MLFHPRNKELQVKKQKMGRPDRVRQQQVLPNKVSQACKCLCTTTWMTDYGPYLKDRIHQTAS